MQYYKSLTLAFCLLMSTALSGFGASWQNANQAYSQGHYAQAIEMYHAIEKQGKVNADLYYNIGNTYFRLKRVGEAILYYERALKLNPRHRDARYNLEIAQSKTLDRIEAVPDFFMVSWWNKIASTLHPSVWGWVSLLFFLVSGLGGLGSFFAPTLRMRKWSFWLGSGSIAGWIFCLLFAFQTRAAYYDDREEIVTQAVVSVKGSPDARGTNLFLLHEGTKVTRTDQITHWKKIQTADGNEGWIEANAATSI